MKPMMSTTSTQSLLDQITDVEFWKTVNPSLSINEEWALTAPDAIAFETGDLEEIQQNLKREGYFQIDPILPEVEIFRMAIGVETLYDADIMTPFAFVYDEFWRVGQRLAGLLSAILGENYQQLPAFWVWRVDANDNDGGWSPHRDRTSNTLLPDGTPSIITVWIPLSDAMPLNGCMYALPAHLDPNYRGDLKTYGFSNLQDIRALPAPAGSVLGWSHSLLHWGGRSSHKAPFPRISLSYEFQRGDVKPYNDFVLSPQTPPTFSQRLALVGMVLDRYKHMYELPPALAEVTADLIKLY